MTRAETRAERARIVEEQQPTGIEPVIKAAVEETLRQLADRPAPRTVRFLRSQAASRYLGKHDAFLEDERRTAGRDGIKPAFPFKRLGKSIVYDVADLDRVMNDLPYAEVGR